MMSRRQIISPDFGIQVPDHLEIGFCRLGNDLDGRVLGTTDLNLFNRMGRIEVFLRQVKPISGRVGQDQLC
jgi:hypothetical protein